MRKRLVVVGNGMAGIACLEQILTYAPPFDVTVFGDETHVNYNRVLLSSVLAGEKDADDIVINPREWYEKHQIDLRVGVRIVDVNAEAKIVIGDDGSVTSYDLLLLATGSYAWMPPIEGLNREGVLVFPHAGRRARAAEASESREESGGHRRRVCSVSRPRADCRCRGATSPSFT
jgi:nitrite reductase (NADH) large subunit